MVHNDPGHQIMNLGTKKALLGVGSLSVVALIIILIIYKVGGKDEASPKEDKVGPEGSEVKNEVESDVVLKTEADIFAQATKAGKFPDELLLEYSAKSVSKAEDLFRITSPKGKFAVFSTFEKKVGARIKTEMKTLTLEHDWKTLVDSLVNLAAARFSLYPAASAELRPEITAKMVNEKSPLELAQLYTSLTLCPTLTSQFAERLETLDGNLSKSNINAFFLLGKEFNCLEAMQDDDDSELDEEDIVGYVRNVSKERFLDSNDFETPLQNDNPDLQKFVRNYRAITEDMTKSVEDIIYTEFWDLLVIDSNPKIRNFVLNNFLLPRLSTLWTDEASNEAICQANDVLFQLSTDYSNFEGDWDIWNAHAAVFVKALFEMDPRNEEFYNASIPAEEPCEDKVSLAKEIDTIYQLQTLLSKENRDAIDRKSVKELLAFFDDEAMAEKHSKFLKRNKYTLLSSSFPSAAQLENAIRAHLDLKEFNLPTLEVLYEELKNELGPKPNLSKQIIGYDDDVYLYHHKEFVKLFTTLVSSKNAKDIDRAFKLLSKMSYSGLEVIHSIITSESVI